MENQQQLLTIAAVSLKTNPDVSTLHLFRLILALVVK